MAVCRAKLYANGCRVPKRIKRRCSVAGSEYLHVLDESYVLW